MNDLSVTVGGFVASLDNDYRETSFDVSSKEIMEKLPQMLKTMTGDMVAQIEDPDHPLNGWQITFVCIEPIDDDDDDDETEWDSMEDDEGEM